MKFETYFRLHIVDDWRSNYLAYGNLKKLISALSDQNHHLYEQHSLFRTQMEIELAKLDQHYKSHLQMALGRLCRPLQLSSSKSAIITGKQVVIPDNEVKILLNLFSFSRLNQAGVRRIIRRYETVCHGAAGLCIDIIPKAMTCKFFCDELLLRVLNCVNEPVSRLHHKIGHSKRESSQGISEFSNLDLSQSLSSNPRDTSRSEGGSSPSDESTYESDSEKETKFEHILGIQKVSFGVKSGAVMHTSHDEESVSDADSMLHQIESCMPPFRLPRSRSAPLCVGASNLTHDLSSSDPNPSAPAAPQTSLADPTKMEEDSKSNVVSRRQSLSSSVCSLSSSGYSDKQRGRKRMRLQMEKVNSTFAGGQPCFERWPSHPQLFQVGAGALPPAGPPRMQDAGPQMQDAGPQMQNAGPQMQIETGRFTTPPSMSLPSLPPSIGPNLQPFRVRRPEPAIPFQIPAPFSVKAPVPGGVKAPVPGGVKAPVKAYMSSSTPTTFSVLPHSVTPASAASAPCSAFKPKIAPIKWSRSQPDPKVRAQSDLGNPFVTYQPQNQHPYASTMQNALTTPHGLPLCAPPNGWTARARAATLASMNGSRDPRQWKIHGALSTVEQIAPNRANIQVLQPNQRLTRHQPNRTHKTIDLDQLFQSKKKRYKGIRRTSSNKWVARIEHNGQQKHLGTYSTAAEAAMVYDRALYQVLSLTHPEKIVLKRFNFPERIAESSRHGYFR